MGFGKHGQTISSLSFRGQEEPMQASSAAPWVGSHSLQGTVPLPCISSLRPSLYPTALLQARVLLGDGFFPSFP